MIFIIIFFNIFYVKNVSKIRYKNFLYRLNIYKNYKAHNDRFYIKKIGMYL